MPYKDPEKQKKAQRESTVRNRDIRRIRQKARRKGLRDYIDSQKEGVPCADCGKCFHKSAMHYDHLPGFVKVAGIREMVNRFQSKQMIEAEIKKCEIVCANCHAVRSYDRYKEENPDE